jgi:hypothetical protein
VYSDIQSQRRQRAQRTCGHHSPVSSSYAARCDGLAARRRRFRQRWHVGLAESTLCPYLLQGRPQREQAVFPYLFAFASTAARYSGSTIRCAAWPVTPKWSPIAAHVIPSSRIAAASASSTRDTYTRFRRDEGLWCVTA